MRGRMLAAEKCACVRACGRAGVPFHVQDGTPWRRLSASAMDILCVLRYQEIHGMAGV